MVVAHEQRHRGRVGACERAALEALGVAADLGGRVEGDEHTRQHTLFLAADLEALAAPCSVFHHATASVSPTTPAPLPAGPTPEVPAGNGADLRVRVPRSW